jgi:hypothetical protein
MPGFLTIPMSLMRGVVALTQQTMRSSLRALLALNCAVFFSGCSEARSPVHNANAPVQRWSDAAAPVLGADGGESERLDAGAIRDASRRVADSGSPEDTLVDAAPDLTPPPVAPPPKELPAEICDGIDNDGNGKIDDADIEGDGVCDCLKIATLGIGGTWGDRVVFTDWPNNRSQNPVVALGNRKLTDQLLAPYQVIIILDVSALEGIGGGDVMLTANHIFTDDEVAALGRWVNAGGGLLATSGYRSDEALEVVNVNRLLAPFGMAYSTTKLDVDGYVENWSADPLTTGVSRVFTNHGVEPDGANARTLARDGADHVVFQASKAGHVLLWADEWITYHTLWQQRSDQQVERLWLNMLDWLSPLQHQFASKPGK